MEWMYLRYARAKCYQNQKIDQLNCASNENNLQYLSGDIYSKNIGSQCFGGNIYSKKC